MLKRIHTFLARVGNGTPDRLTHILVTTPTELFVVQTVTTEV
jgi:hypothetical protein